MKQRINPQEIYLLERYTSLEYFGELRDTWEAMIKHLEACLERFMLSLPKNYRAKPLPEQPDVVWGNRVLPNFRDTLQGLNTGFVLLTHGDLRGLSHAWGPKGDFKGQMDFWAGWMEREDEDTYGAYLSKSVMFASNICRTERAGWGPFELANYNDCWGPLNPPSHWPRYRIQNRICVATGEKLEKSGVYVPDIEASCAEFLYTGYGAAPAAKVLVGKRPILHPTTGEQYDEEPIIEPRNCTWYLVERALEDENDIANNNSPESENIRVPAGGTCPETGFYFTPAKLDSRSLFQKGEVMPDVGSKYGLTIWQWDGNQST